MQAVGKMMPVRAIGLRVQMSVSIVSSVGGWGKRMWPPGVLPAGCCSSSGHDTRPSKLSVGLGCSGGICNSFHHRPCSRFVVST